MIHRTWCKMRMQGPLLNRKFRMVTGEHKTKHKVLCDCTGHTPVKLALFLIRKPAS